MRALLPVLLGSLLPATALAQSGTLDQVSSANTALNVNNDVLVWQQQIRVGVSGQLEGFTLTFQGPVGAQGDIALRLGDAWSTLAPEWAVVFTKTSALPEPAFFDVSALGLLFDAGDTFGIELAGNNSGLEVRASYASPALYPEELYLNGPHCFADCGWRVAFQTWMLGASPNYCTSTANSTGTAAAMSFSGTTSLAAGDLVLQAGPVPNQPGMFLQGSSQTSQPLGPGTLCVALPFNRLQFAFGANGTMAFEVDYAAGPAQFQINAGSTWHFQCWYRDPGVGPGFNLSDGLTLTFTP